MNKHDELWEKYAYIPTETKNSTDWIYTLILVITTLVAVGGIALVFML